MHTVEELKQQLEFNSAENTKPWVRDGYKARNKNRLKGLCMKYGRKMKSSQWPLHEGFAETKAAETTALSDGRPQNLTLVNYFLQLAPIQTHSFCFSFNLFSIFCFFLVRPFKDNSPKSNQHQIMKNNFCLQNSKYL